MSDHQLPVGDAKQGRKASRHRNRQIRNERRARRELLLRSNEWAEVEQRGRGLISISRVKTNAEITLDELQNEPREATQDAAETYFNTPVDIFSSESVTGWRGEFSGLFPFLAIWPEPLERRLQDYDNKRYGKTDQDVDNLLDMTVEIFLSNLFWNIIWKRGLLAAAIVAECALTFGAYRMIAQASSWGYNAGIFAAFLAGSGFILWFYMSENDDHFRNRYVPALRATVQEVSRLISDRMRTISVVVEQYSNLVDSLIRTGETLADPKARMKNKDYRDGSAYLWTQNLVWLPIRTLGMETRLRNKMESAQKRHAKLDALGFVLTVLVMLGGVAAALSVHFAWSHMVFHTMRGGGIPALLELEQGLILIVLLVFVAAASFLSYYNKSWNSAADMLQRYFDTDKWATFSNSGFDARLAARVQLAMIHIEHLTRLIKK